MCAGRVPVSHMHVSNACAICHVSHDENRDNTTRFSLQHMHVPHPRVVHLDVDPPPEHSSTRQISACMRRRRLSPPAPPLTTHERCIDVHVAFACKVTLSAFHLPPHPGLQRVVPPPTPHVGTRTRTPLGEGTGGGAGCARSGWPSTDRGHVRGRRVRRDRRSSRGRRWRLARSQYGWNWLAEKTGRSWRTLIVSALIEPRRLWQSSAIGSNLRMRSR